MAEMVPEDNRRSANEKRFRWRWEPSRCAEGTIKVLTSTRLGPETKLAVHQGVQQPSSISTHKVAFIRPETAAEATSAFAR
jgi:hypothetical protein